MRIAIVGGGVAGAMLAWRLGQRSRRTGLTIYAAGQAAMADATGCSGGLVRGFEIAPATCRQAAESLAELRGSSALRDWTGYTETGSAYLMQQGSADLAPSLTALKAAMPGSAEVIGGTDLAARYPFRALPAGTIAVAERQAGYISPHRLRSSALASVAGAGADIQDSPVHAITAAPAVALADGTSRGYDAVVLSAGPWTPGLLRSSGMPGQRLRTKQIQYCICAATFPGLGAFVDDTSGLYGRPAGRDCFLLGFGCDHWDVDPERVRPDPAARRAALTWAQRRLGTVLRSSRTIASADCYSDDGELRLRRCGGTGSAVFTFSGGSGSAAKTVIAASREAARALSQLEE